jgi:hypothetical protein
LPKNSELGGILLEVSKRPLFFESKVRARCVQIVCAALAIHSFNCNQQTTMSDYQQTQHLADLNKVQLEAFEAELKCYVERMNQKNFRTILGRFVALNPASMNKVQIEAFEAVLMNCAQFQLRSTTVFKHLSWLIEKEWNCESEVENIKVADCIELIDNIKIDAPPEKKSVAVLMRNAPRFAAAQDPSKFDELD